MDIRQSPFMYCLAIFVVIVVIVQSAFGSREFTAVNIIVLCLRFFYKFVAVCRSVIAVLQHQSHAGRTAIFWNIDVHDAALPRPDRSERGLILRFSAVK